MLPVHIQAASLYCSDCKDSVRLGQNTKWLAVFSGGSFGWSVNTKDIVLSYIELYIHIPQCGKC